MQQSTVMLGPSAQKEKKVDHGYMLLNEFSSKGESSKGFNSTAPRFKTVKRQDVDVQNQPGPDVYDCETYEKSTLSTVTKKIKSNANPTKGAAPAFMDSSRRVLFEAELRDANQKPQMGTYFRGQQPFLKKTFNASLPPFKYV